MRARRTRPFASSTKENVAYTLQQMEKEFFGGDTPLFTKGDGMRVPASGGRRTVASYNPKSSTSSQVAPCFNEILSLFCGVQFPVPATGNSDPKAAEMCD